MNRSITGAAALALLAAAPLSASAAQMSYFANLGALNNSGVSGTAMLTWDDVADTLTVKIDAMGLAPNFQHIQHIHGRFQSGTSGMAADSVSPPPSADTDNDGFVELGEGGVFYGPVLLPLSYVMPGGANDDDGDAMTAFPTAPGGMISFMETYDLTDPDTFASDPTSGNKYVFTDLTPLTFREIVIHGMMVPDDAGLDMMGNPTMGICDGSMDSSDICSVAIPVASGAIQPVPLPAAGWALIAGIGALFGYGRLKRRA